MKLRPSLLLLPLVAALSLGTLSPVQAVVQGDPVTDLAVAVAQTPGSHDSWTVTPSWTANAGGVSFGVAIVDHADGSITSGAYYGSKDVTGTSVALKSGNLAADKDYWVVVQPIAPEAGATEIAQFHTPVLDTTAPNGSYKLNKTSAYLNPSFDFEEDFDGSAKFKITQTAVDAGSVTRKVIPGDGSPAVAWTSTNPFPLTYTRTGTFTAKVVLTDKFANSREISLPVIKVVADTIAPKVKITRPENPGKIASWRTIRGTASDVGSGVQMIGVFLVEKRGARWWAYDFGKKKWLKGERTLRKTMQKSKAMPLFMEPTASDAWKTPKIKGLTKGLLHVEAVAFDKNFNGRPVELEQRIR